MNFDYTGEKRRILALLADGPNTTAEIQAALAGEASRATLCHRLKALRDEGLVQRDYPRGRAATWGLAKPGRGRRVAPDTRLERLLAQYLDGGVTLVELARAEGVPAPTLATRVQSYVRRTGRQAEYRRAVRAVYRLAAARRRRRVA
jgi:DNA-binding transcriptional ArsR family regulator